MANKEHSKNFLKVENHYRNGFWTIERVRAVVGKWITEEEFKEITGQDFAR